MDLQPDEQQPPPIPPIPVARPAATPPDVQPADTGPWWAPRPITGLQAAGDIAIVGMVLVVPQAAAALVGASVHTTAEMPPAHMILGANSMIWATVALVAIYLTWRSGQPLASIGLRWVNPLAALGAAIAAVFAIYGALVVTSLVTAVLTGASRETMTAPAREITGMFGPPTWSTMLWIAGSAAVFEEIVFRGFILTRLRVLAGNWFWAVLIGMVLFALPHIWQGRWAVMLVMPVAAVLSILFVRRRSLLAPMMAHFLFNFLQLAILRMVMDHPQWQEMLQPAG